MDAFFTELGRAVLAQWTRADFALAAFPAIAGAALEARPPAEHVDLAAFVRGFLLDDAQPPQTGSGFGEPELVVYAHPRFYVQVLFWLDGTTDIHQHGFSGAFHVVAGSSLHTQFTFENARVVTSHLHVGDVRTRTIELLATGRTVPIVSGDGFIHSLFHLETPSITVVVRTHHDPGTDPQFNYLPPHVALDPTAADALTNRRRQLLDVLEASDDPAYPELILTMVTELDFARGFLVLQHCAAHLRDLDAEEMVLAAFREKHGALASGIAATLDESVRRNVIAGLRSAVRDPEHRFFLALLANVPARADLLTLVAQRFPDDPPVETVLRWAEELQEATELGTVILDAEFPETIAVADGEQPDLFREALRHFVAGGPALPAALRPLDTATVARLRAAFARSSLRSLLD